MFFLLTFSMFWLASSLCRLHRFMQEIQKHPHEPVHVQEHKALWCCRTESGRTSVAQELKSGEANNNSALFLFFSAENTKIYSPKRQTATTTKRILNCGKHFHYVLNKKKRIFLHLITTPLEPLEEHLVNTSNLNSKREIVLDIYTDMICWKWWIYRGLKMKLIKKRQKCHVGCLIIAPRVHLC